MDCSELKSHPDELRGWAGIGLTEIFILVVVAIFHFFYF
jgi:hypothetical protein